METSCAQRSGTRPRWCFAFESYGCPLSRNLQTATWPAAATETELARLSFSQTWSLCNQGRTVSILTNVERHNGMAAWWRLARLLGRHAGVSTQLSLLWTGSNRAADFFVNGFCNEVQSGEPLGDSWRVAGGRKQSQSSRNASGASVPCHDHRRGLPCEHSLVIS